MRKVYVHVDSDRSGSGIVPRTISWPDGRVWDIDKVTHACASPYGEYEGVRYTVIIGSSEKYIYRAGRSWYVLA